MDESFLPFWLVLLIGMWVISLTVWQHPASHREVRVWAGLLTWVYLVLFFVALRTVPGAKEAQARPGPSWPIQVIEFWFCVVCSLSAAVWTVGRVSGTSRRISYLILTISNSVIAYLAGSLEVAVGLLVIAGLSSKSLMMRLPGSRGRTGLRESLTRLFQFQTAAVPPETTGAPWLVGGLTGIICCLLLGTIAYSLRYETSRTSPSTRLPALPGLDSLERQKILVPARTDLVDLLTGARADVLILLAIILFLCLAISSTVHSPSTMIGPRPTAESLPGSDQNHLPDRVA